MYTYACMQPYLPKCIHQMVIRIHMFVCIRTYLHPYIIRSCVCMRATHTSYGHLYDCASYGRLECTHACIGPYVYICMHPYHPYIIRPYVHMHVAHGPCLCMIVRMHACDAHTHAYIEWHMEACMKYARAPYVRTYIRTSLQRTSVHVHGCIHFHTYVRSINCLSSR
jgi:hypothetical protein